jgi:hypothetical protein
MSKRRNRNKRIDASHVRLYGWLLDSPAYLSLSCAARAVLIETARAYDGTNNGRTVDTAGIGTLQHCAGHSFPRFHRFGGARVC